MKRSKVKGRSSKSRSRPKARRRGATVTARAAKRRRTKPKRKPVESVRAKSAHLTARATRAQRNAPKKRPKRTAKTARKQGSPRDSAIPESQVTPISDKPAPPARPAASGNGSRRTPPKPRIIDVLPRDAPISRPATAYESEALSILSSEFPAADPSEANARIEQRLRDKQLGEFDRGRIEALRSFKSALAEEIQRGSSSDYFIGSHGLYASPEDFDHARLASDFAAKYPSISQEAVAAFVPIAVYCYYLR